MSVLQQLAQLFHENLAPMFIIIAVGYVAQRKLAFDLRTLNRANIYVFVPALLVDRLMRAEVTLGDAGAVAAIGTAGIIVMLVLVRFLTPLRGAQRQYLSVIALSAGFSNTGNFGIPLMALAFGPAGVFVQSILLMVNNLMAYSLGVYVVAHRSSPRQTLINFLRTPIPFAFVLVGILLATGRTLPGPLAQGVRYLGDGLIPVALVTLGAQLADTKIRSYITPIAWAVGWRLLAGPAVMAGLVYLASMTGMIGWDTLPAKVLIVSFAIPAAVNTVIISMEYDAQPQVAAGAVFVGTVLSAGTLSVVLLLVSR
jgi:predicted permease